MKASLGEVKAEQCMGHFPSYPTFPVALLAYQHAYASGLLLKRIVKRENIQYFVKKALLNVKTVKTHGLFQI